MGNKTNKTIDRLWGHERFGLKSMKDVKQLGKREAKIEISLRLPSRDWLFEYKLPKRRKMAAQWYETAFNNLKTAVPMKIVKVKKGHVHINSFTCKMTATHLVDLLKRPGNFDVYLKSLEGIKPQKQQPPRLPRRRKWYAVRARYAIQVEGATRGRQSYEDRIVLVRARSFEQAAKKFRKQERDYGQPYLNSDCEMVRWHLERITDIYETDVELLDSEDTEVYSRLSARRMKRQYEWHPHAKPSGEK